MLLQNNPKKPHQQTPSQLIATSSLSSYWDKPHRYLQKIKQKKQPRRATLFGFTLQYYSAGCSAGCCLFAGCLFASCSAGCCLTCWVTSFRAIPLPSTIAAAKVFEPSGLQYFFAYQITLLFWYCGVTSGVKGRITACPTVSLLTIICWSAVRYLLFLLPPLLLCVGIVKSLRISMMMIFVGE